MTFMGMTPALGAGIIVAMTTFALQSVQNLDPIFKITSATTLRSSAWTRPPQSLAVLDSTKTGRSKIMVIQLQGNLFFGNAVDLADRIKEALANDKPLIVIIDFTLVTTMDSTAAQTVNKLKNSMTQIFKVETNIFVMGSHRGLCLHYLVFVWSFQLLSFFFAFRVCRFIRTIIFVSLNRSLARLLIYIRILPDKIWAVDRNFGGA